MARNEARQGLDPPIETWEFPVDYGVVVARPDLPSLFCLNPTAAVIWKVYQETGSEEDAASALVERWAAPRELAEKDVRSTLNDWAATGLLGPRKTATLPKWERVRRDAEAVTYCSIEGASFLIRTDSAEFMAEIAPRLESLRTGVCTPDVTIAVWRCAEDRLAIVSEDEVVSIEQGVRAARAVLFQELVRRARAGRKWLALLHAAACGIDGRCVLMPAASCGGKSTLAAALMGSGFAVYSDDFIGIEAGSFEIPAMPFPIAVRSGAWGALRTWIPEIDHGALPEPFAEQIRFVPPSRAGTIPPGNAVSIAFTEWIEGTAVSLQKLSTADAIARLNESGFWVAHDRDSIGAFVAWLDRLPKFTLTYSELTEAVERILGWL